MPKKGISKLQEMDPGIKLKWKSSMTCFWNHSQFSRYLTFCFWWFCFNLYLKYVLSDILVTWHEDIFSKDILKSHKLYHKTSRNLFCKLCLKNIKFDSSCQNAEFSHPKVYSKLICSPKAYMPEWQQTNLSMHMCATVSFIAIFVLFCS